MKAVKRNILLNPGPATTTDSVKWAQVVPDICPRETEFGELMKDVSAALTCFAADSGTYTTILFGGSGTAAVESILSSVIGEPDAVLIVNNGVYGRRMIEIAAAYGLHVVEFHSPVDRPIDFDRLEASIRNSVVRLSHLAVVHHETTSGLLNDVRRIGEICGKYQLDLIVDAMSSYGAIPIHMPTMNIRYLAASSNKNLQGMPGVSFVIAENVKLTESAKNPLRSYYLNLHAQHQFFAKTGQMRFTPPVQTFYALKQAIRELQMEGLEQRYARYSLTWQTLIAGLERFGLTTLVPAEHHSKLLTAVMEPECDGYDFTEMHDFFYRHGFTIYPGKLDHLKTFRIANIGAISHEDMEAFLLLMNQYLRSIGHSTGKEAGP